MFHADNLYSIARIRDDFNNPEYIDAMRFYINDLKLESLTTWYEYENTMIIDMAMINEKLAILIIKSKDINPDG